MKYVKVMATVVATLMVTVVGIAAISVDGAETTSTNYGEFNVFAYGEDGWDNPVRVSGYNAYLALDNYCDTKGLNFVADGRYTVTKNNSWGDYTAINSDYGKVTSIGASSVSGDVDSLKILVLVNGNWVEPVYGLGHYKPFSDYDVDFRTANIALYSGTDLVTDKALLPVAGTKLCPIVNVAGDAFKVTFNVKLVSPVIFGAVDNTISEETLRSGIIKTGYGSDAALAFKDAFGDSTTIDTDVAKSYGFNDSGYGYMTELYGITGGSEDLDGDGYDDRYYYWASYLGSTNANMAGFMLGFYTPLIEATPIGGGFVQDEFTFHYIF